MSLTRGCPEKRCIYVRKYLDCAFRAAQEFPSSRTPEFPSMNHARNTNALKFQNFGVFCNEFKGFGLNILKPSMTLLETFYSFPGVLVFQSSKNVSMALPQGTLGNILPASKPQTPADSHFHVQTLSVLGVLAPEEPRVTKALGSWDFEVSELPNPKNNRAPMHFCSGVRLLSDYGALALYNVLCCWDDM